MVKKTIISYIAGILDGEGCIGFCSWKQKNTKFTYSPMIGIYNTDKEMLTFVVNNINLFLHTKYVLRECKPTYKENKMGYSINIEKIENILKILQLLVPYLISKKQRGKLMIKYCQSRLQSMRGYTSFELDTIQKVYNLNHQKGRSLHKINVERGGKIENDKTIT